MGNRLVALDGVRGIAAICVFIFHAGGIPLLPRFANGYLAVDLFFLISGFILAKVYTPRFSEGLSLWHFTCTRFFRFYPLYFFGFVLGLLYAVTRGFLGRSAGDYGLPWSAVFGSVMLPAFNLIGPHSGGLYPFNGPSWPLFFEMLLNVMLFPILIRMRFNYVVMLLIVLFIILVFYTISFGELAYGPKFVEAFPGFVRSAFSFSFGVALFRWPPRLDWLPKTRLAPLAMALFFLPNLGTGLVQALYDLAFVAVFGPLIALSSIDAPAREGIVTDGYELLGRLSYPLYMVHATVIAWFGAVLARTHPLGTLPSILFAMSLIVVALLLATVAMLVDERLQGWFRRRFRREPVTAPIRSPSSAG